VLGVVYLANAVAALSASPAGERAFRGLRHMIGEGSGCARKRSKAGGTS
jgi:hypothetical protein